MERCTIIKLYAMKNFLLIVAAFAAVCFLAVNCTAPKEEKHQLQSTSEPIAVMKSHVVVDSCALAEEEIAFDAMEDVVQFELLNKEPFSWYNNLIFKDEKLVSYLRNKIEDSFIPFSIGREKSDGCEICEKLQNLEIKEIVPQEIFRRFVGFRAVNGWSEEFAKLTSDYTQEKAIKDRYKSNELFYLGRVKLSNSFESFMFMLSIKDNEIVDVYRKAFLINMVGDTITSVSSIFHYSMDVVSAWSGIWKDNNDIFHYSSDSADDCIGLNEMGEEEREIPIVNFKFDKKGRVVILTDKKQTR